MNSIDKLLSAKSWDDVVDAFEETTYDDMVIIFNGVQEYLYGDSFYNIVSQRGYKLEDIIGDDKIDEDDFNKNDEHFIKDDDGKWHSMSDSDMYRYVLNYLTHGWSSLEDALKIFEFATRYLH